MVDALYLMRCLKEIEWRCLRKGKRIELGCVKWEGTGSECDVKRSEGGRDFLSKSYNKGLILTSISRLFLPECLQRDLEVMCAHPFRLSSSGTNEGGSKLHKQYLYFPVHLQIGDITRSFSVKVFQKTPHLKPEIMKLFAIS
jgi:hypothetical protein